MRSRESRAFFHCSAIARWGNSGVFIFQMIIWFVSFYFMGGKREGGGREGGGEDFFKFFWILFSEEMGFTYEIYYYHSFFVVCFVLVAIFIDEIIPQFCETWEKKNGEGRRHDLNSGSPKVSELLFFVSLFLFFVFFAVVVEQMKTPI